MQHLGKRKRIIYLMRLFSAFLLYGCSGSSENTGDYRPEFRLEYEATKTPGIVYPVGLTPAAIFIETPLNGTIISPDQETIIVKGNIIEGDFAVAGLLIQDRDVAIEPDGSFQTKVKIRKNDTRFEIVELIAEDNGGYLSKERIVLFKGQIAFADALTEEGIGISIGRLLFEWMPGLTGDLFDFMSTNLSRFVNGLADSLPKTPIPINLGFLNRIAAATKVPMGKTAESIDLNYMFNANLSKMNIAFGLGRSYSEQEHFDLTLNMTAWARGREEILAIPPTIEISDALTPRGDNRACFAFAISCDTVNRMMFGFVNLEPSFALPANPMIDLAVPGMDLPENTEVRLVLNTPPILEFKNGKGILFMPNILFELYMNSIDQDGIELRMAIDLITEIAADVAFLEDDFFLKFDLAVPEISAFYLVDRMGIEQLIDLQDIMDGLLPQVMDAIKMILDQSLSIDLAALFPVMRAETAYMTIPEIRMDDGYLSIFIGLE